MRVVSGIQPTGKPHLGNYLGAIRNWVRMQDEMEDANRAQAAAGGSAQGNQCLFFLADLHAISMPHVPAELRAATLEMVAALVACGIDPDRSVLFNQAQVPAHSELQWLLNGTARMGWLNRMTQFKDKSGKNREGASIALFTYPVLQAADVLLYQATHVPVGEDQKQHLELARDIAQKFNNDFASDEDPVFTLPEPYIPPEAARIMSLRDGTAKMSKSDPSDMSRINLSDDADTMMKKIKKAKTDPEPLPSEAAGPRRPSRGAEPRGDLRGLHRAGRRGRAGRIRRRRVRHLQAGARRIAGRDAGADRRALQRTQGRPRIARRNPRPRSGAGARNRRTDAVACLPSARVDPGISEKRRNYRGLRIGMFNSGSARHVLNTVQR